MGLAASPHEVPEPIHHPLQPLQQVPSPVAVCQSDTVWHIQELQQPLPHTARGHLPPLHCQLLRLGTLEMFSSSSLFFFPFILFPSTQTPCEEWFSFIPSMFGKRFLLSHPGVKGILRSYWAINKYLSCISVVPLWWPGHPSWAFHLWNRMDRMVRRHPLFKATLHVSSSLCQEWIQNDLSWGERRNARSRQLNKNINTASFQQKLIFIAWDNHRQEKRILYTERSNSEFLWNYQSSCSNSHLHRQRWWSARGAKGTPTNNAAMEVRLLGKWPSSTECLSKITKGNCPSRTDFMFVLQWQIPSCAHSTEKGENMEDSPRFAALSHSVHRRKWLHVTCASGDTKCVYTWAAERGVGCPKRVMTWASAVLCNQGRQGLITSDMRLCQHPSPTAAQGQEPQGEGEQGIYTPERPRRALVVCVTPRGEACPRALSLHFPKRTELCFQVSTLPLFFNHVYR